MLNHLNHVAIAVPNLEVAVRFYRDVLGAEVSEPLDLPAHGVTSVFVTLSNTKLELLCPLGDNSPIAGFLAKNPRGGIHHLCFGVQDIEKCTNRVVAAGVRVLKDPEPGAHGNPVVFMHPKDTLGCLMELEESIEGM